MHSRRHHTARGDAHYPLSSFQHTASGMKPPPVIGARSAAAFQNPHMLLTLPQNPAQPTELNQQTECSAYPAYPTPLLV